MTQCSYCSDRSIITIDGDPLCDRHAAAAAHTEGHAACAKRDEFRTHGDSSAIDDNEPFEDLS